MTEQNHPGTDRQERHIKTALRTCPSGGLCDFSTQPLKLRLHHIYGGQIGNQNLDKEKGVNENQPTP